ncbi:MAG: hypothetical protein QOI12_3666 [Alphaproteobacteria bacterium]|nr:hypothetical protein [Alphaproteobacteria bacterium]
MLTLGEIDALERQLKAALVARNKRGDTGVTIVEAIDEAELWPAPFDSLASLAPKVSIEHLVSRAPGFVCAVASEVGSRFEGVGTIFWANFEQSLGLAISQLQRHAIGNAFETLANKYNTARPSESAFSEHFSIIAWPIANALLPVDLVGPVTRLLARGPVRALPARGRAPDFESLRAWANAAEGARLVDWLRFEEPTSRVLTALLTENRDQTLPEASYRRIHTVIQSQPEAFFATRSARARARNAKSPSGIDQTPGRLVVSLDGPSTRLFVTWPALPPGLFDEARSTARANAWRPRLWGVGALLHPDTALSGGPLPLALSAPPVNNIAAYPDAETIFGSGSDVALTLAARTVEWSSYLVFEPNKERTQAEQRFEPLTGNEGLIWLATADDSANLIGLRRLGSICGYQLLEANLDNSADRAILAQHQLLSDQRRLLLSRHPSDAIAAPQATVCASRPFLLFAGPQLDKDAVGEVRTQASGSHAVTLAGVAGNLMLRTEAAPPAPTAPMELLLFERDAAFEALVERRLQARVESRLPLVDVPCHLALEIDGVLIAYRSHRLPSLPATLPSSCDLFAPLYDDTVRTKLLVSGHGVLKFTIGRSISMHVPLQRLAASVEWNGERPELVGAEMETVLAAASARLPHRFSAVAIVASPARGATAFGLLLSDGRIADPVQILTSPSFNLGDLSASFGEDVGSRRLLDGGSGIAEIAQARVAWARGRCTSLSAVAAKKRVVRQFDEPLLVGLCGRPWLQAEKETEVDATTDPLAALWRVALEQKLVEVPYPERRETEIFANSFVEFARRHDSGWPELNAEPAEGAMDDALNDAFSESLQVLHERGELLDVENDFDFGSPQEDWIAAAKEAIKRVQRPRLVALIAPRDGAHVLSCKSYRGLAIPELAEDIAAWTQTWALSRARLSAEDAGRALQLWLSPAACDDAKAAVRIIARDPFVARAIRYAALRLGV